MKSKIFRYHLLILGLLALVACIKSPSEEEPDPEPTPGEVTYTDLALLSLSITPAANEQIFGTVRLDSEMSSGRWTGHISGYKTNLTQLVASFEVVAARVTINGVEQESGKTVNDFSRPVIYRLHADDGQYKEFTALLTNGDYTGNPVLGIVTEGEENVTSRDNWLRGRMVIDQQEGACEELSCELQIKGRGHNSWSREKKPYALKLSEKLPVMGMSKHKRWVLLANAGDRTLLRNRVAF